MGKEPGRGNGRQRTITDSNRRQRTPPEGPSGDEMEENGRQRTATDRNRRQRTPPQGLRDRVARGRAQPHGTADGRRQPWRGPRRGGIAKYLSVSPFTPAPEGHGSRLRDPVRTRSREERAGVLALATLGARPPPRFANASVRFSSGARRAQRTSRALVARGSRAKRAQPAE